MADSYQFRQRVTRLGEHLMQIKMSKHFKEPRADLIPLTVHHVVIGTTVFDP